MDAEDEGDKLVQVLNDIGAEPVTGKLLRFEDSDEPLDSYFWLNYPSREGYCVASNPSNPALYHYRYQLRYIRYKDITGTLFQVYRSIVYTGPFGIQAIRCTDIL